MTLRRLLRLRTTTLPPAHTAQDNAKRGLFGETRTIMITCAFPVRHGIVLHKIMQPGPTAKNPVPTDASLDGSGAKPKATGANPLATTTYASRAR